MTLDEAIYYCDNAFVFNLSEYEELGNLLKELKELREIKEEYQKGMDCSYATFKYKKAIDDFAEKISIYGTYDDYGNVIDVLEIAEQVKAGGIDERS